MDDGKMIVRNKWKPEDPIVLATRICNGDTLLNPELDVIVIVSVAPSTTMKITDETPNPNHKIASGNQTIFGTDCSAVTKKPNVSSTNLYL